MKKLKIYLDTSIISHLFADDTPEKQEDTLKLWQDFILNKYEIFISSVTIGEIEKCYEPKRSEMIEKTKQIHTNLLIDSDEVDALADEYIKNEILKQKSFDDCSHIAFAVVSNCDLIVSWNFKHLVNYTTIKKVKIVNSINNYKEIGIISPTMLIEGDE